MPAQRSAQGLRGLAVAVAVIALAIGCGEKPAAPTTGKQPNGAGRQTAANGTPTGAGQQQTRDGGEVPGSSQSPGEPVPLLVSVEELRSRIGEPNLRIVDARPVEAYAAGHIPQAAWVETASWKEQSLAEKGLEDKEFWGEQVGLLGIDESTNVVVYAEDPTDAARVWWTLKYVGIPHVALLDGGWQAWQQAGGDVSTEEPDFAGRQFTPKFQTDRLMQIGDLKRSLAAEEVTVIDARTIEAHTGTSGQGARLGRIPGSTHIEWKEFLDADGRFKSPEQIRALLAEKGVTEEKTVVTHCQSGGRAALDAFALELAGIRNVRNYYCGWSEWSKDESAPVEK